LSRGRYGVNEILSNLLSLDGSTGFENIGINIGGFSIFNTWILLLCRMEYLYDIFKISGMNTLIIEKSRIETLKVFMTRVERDKLLVTGLPRIVKTKIMLFWKKIEILIGEVV
jgi:hypothetical protein